MRIFLENGLARWQRLKKPNWLMRPEPRAGSKTDRTRKEPAPASAIGRCLPPAAHPTSTSVRTRAAESTGMARSGGRAHLRLGRRQSAGPAARLGSVGQQQPNLNLFYSPRLAGSASIRMKLDGRQQSKTKSARASGRK